ncbi:catenin beta [Trichonephila clavata]|uniref:Armadillo segment polarity protein n=1 Tax=Trichonephila clavata TaxID=2740835 RepID=A0A8X6EYJ5_TRICU|nr:catenin beta [Trichonephila clavata]
MLLYDNDKVVVSKAAKMLHQVMKRDFSQDIIKVLPHMISTLIHTISFLNNLETVKCIAGILHSVSLHQPGLLAIYKANGIPALVNLLSSPMESILFYTVTTLHNLLLNQEGSKLSVCEAGGLQKLVTLLKHTNESFLSVVVDCLQTLAFRNPKNKLIILEYGGTEKLVHIMRTYKCQTLLWTVSRVLKALTVCCNNKPVIIKAGGMQALAMHLKNQSEKFVLNCLWSLRNLSDAAINERNVESLLNQLINLLGSNDKHIVTCSAGILSNLTCNNNCNKMIVCQAKGVEALVQAIVKAENNEEISEPAICTLRHLTSGHPEAPKIAVYCCSALPAIMKLLEPPSSWALIKAVIGFIRNLAVPPQNQMHLQNIGVIPKLMKLLRAAYQEIQKHHSNVMDKSRTTCIDGIKMEDIIKGTTYALQVLAKHMHNRAVMKELDIVTFLVQILNREKEYFQCAVAGILAELAVDPDAIQMIESSGAVLLLRNALNSTNDQLVEYATTILVHLAAIKPEKYTWLCADLVNALQKDEILTDMDLSITPDPSYQIMGSVNDFESKLNPSLLNLDVQNATVLQPSNLEMELDLQMDLNFESTFDILSPILLSPPQAGNPSKDIIAYLDSSLMHFS